MSRTLRIPIVGLVLSTIMLVGAVRGDEHQQQRTISVSGHGTATGAPDMATMHTGVTTRAVTAREALDANNRDMEQLMHVLQNFGVAAKDIQTTSFSVQPEYQTDQRGRRSMEIIAYNVHNQVTVRLRDLPQIGEVLDALVQAGSNRIHGIQFSIDDEQGLMDQARHRAVRDAQRKAELLAHTAGVKVGKVISISEQPAPAPRPMQMMRGVAVESSVPVATGEQEVATTLYIVFALQD